MQVGSFFEESTDNEKIEAIYGNYNFWSWLRYWWIDTENYVTFMLMDKGYYDYDYEKPNVRTKAALSAAKSDDELVARLSNMGFGMGQSKPMSADEAQRIIMAELKQQK